LTGATTSENLFREHPRAAIAGQDRPGVAQGVIDTPKPTFDSEFVKRTAENYEWSTLPAAAMGTVDEAGRAALENEFVEECRALAPTGRLAGGVKMTTLLARK